MAVLNSHILLLILNLNRLNPPIERHRQANWIKSQNQTHPDPSHIQGYTNTQIKGMEEDLLTKWRAKINK